jgi:DEAD/DEAH box helicase
VSGTIQETIDELRQTLTDYIEATYHIGHPLMVAQRKRLLAQTGGIFQIPYLESTPRYVAGDPYQNMLGLPNAARDAFVRLADSAGGKPVIFDPPYTHQAQAIRETLANRKNLMIMTGTGSGKTESFLLPILGKLAIEACDHSSQFSRFNALRAIVLYPMNALVNDQLGRLRSLFGHPRVVSMFEEWCGRPARFARYTSRTPYAGVRSPTKDGSRLASIGDFFVAIEDGADRHRDSCPRIPEEDARAFELLERLAKRGKWPAKPSVSAWYGAPHTHWRDRSGRYQRAITGMHDAELLTRHEVQESPPDLLITNYSMLEYMMMRPIERAIFDRTRTWLEACPGEKIMVVLDEAHLYRGAQGAEVGLLLRRLRERLGIGPDRFQVICATASFSEEGRATAGQFGAQLSGVPQDTFVPVTGTLATRHPEEPGSAGDVEALIAVDLTKFYSNVVDDQIEGAQPFLSYRRQEVGANLGAGLVAALGEFPPFNLLVNETMRDAIPLAELGTRVFPGVAEEHANSALTRLLALGSRARKKTDEPSLLPCRIHSFFRGLPGLWVCMDPDCAELAPDERGGPAGKLYDQPRDRCSCGAPVLEYFTCRYCGTSYARAYTEDVANPRLLWAEPGHVLRTDAAVFEAYKPLDLLLEMPSSPTKGLPADYDLGTGMLNPPIQSERRRTVFLRPDTGGLAIAADPERSATQPGIFAPCACCGKQYIYGQSSVQDHQTKGDQPFQSLLGTQIRVQPPGPQPATEFAPLRGRKVLVFSDSRQVAARLAPTLQNYSLRDTVRALLPVGFRILANDPQFGSVLVLDNAFLAVIVAAHRFGVRVRPELAAGEMMPRIDSVPMGQVPSGSELIRLMNTPCPANLMRAIVDVLAHKELGLEPLAVASVRESLRLTPRITVLPDLPGVAEDAPSKLDAPGETDLHENLATTLVGGSDAALGRRRYSPAGSKSHAGNRRHLATLPHMQIGTSTDRNLERVHRLPGARCRGF